MFSNKCKTIGVVIEKPSVECHRAICEGVAIAAQRLGYNVAIFNSFGRFGENERHFVGD